MQNYKNHRRISISYHIITLLGILALLIGAIINLRNSSDDNLYSASLLVLAALLILSAAMHGRSFALKAQDRAIKAEEGLRYFILTGKRLDSRLTLKQIIALRFASDEEFPGLAQRAVSENLSNDAIKREIKSWREDLTPRV
jgi:hypothetical protein